MSGWALAFVVTALVAATQAFGGVPGTTVTAIAHVIFYAALVGAAVMGGLLWLRRQRRRGL